MKFFFFLFITFSSVAYSTMSQPCCSKLSEVLGCFIHHEDGAFDYSLQDKKSDKDTEILSYIVSSQNWPILPEQDIPTTTWMHKMVLYVPKKLEHQKVLLYVGGGRNRDEQGAFLHYMNPIEYLNYAEIALATNAIVVELQDVPNQFLNMGGVWKKEDQILAYTYKKVMDDPLKNAYLAGHLPMAKSIVKAMDAITKIVKTEYKIAQTSFILAGASKRAWAVWLAALEDERVEAMIPIVLDVLNTQKSISYICEVHKGCPYALRDYAEEKIPERIQTQAFADLMKIEDPFSYLGKDYDPKYRERLAIPKLLIQASGDDFFVPDSSKWYFKDLPGSENYIRYLPNSLHYFMGNPISKRTDSLASIQKAVETQFGFFLRKTKLPKLTWTLEQGRIHAISSVSPKKAVLWSAFNESSPDFRFLNRHSSWHVRLKAALGFFTKNICDTCYIPTDIPSTCVSGKECKIEAVLSAPKKKGWRATFVELHYEIEGQTFVISTEVLVEAVGS